MLAFDRPWALGILLLVPAIPILRAILRGSWLGVSFPVDPGQFPLPMSLPLASRALRALREVLALSALAAAVIATAGPAIVTRSVIWLGRGNEVVFVLDVSPSMAAADIAPTRLEAAKAIIAGFLAKRRNETVGLVAFGREAALVCPPTTDYAAFASRLATLQPGLYGDGTALGAGIATAVAHAARSSAPEKHIVLLTDGENNAGAMEPATAAMAASRFGMTLTVIGVGSPGEAPAVYIDPATGTRMAGTYRSGFDREALARLAQAGGGRYWSGADRAGLDAAFMTLSEESASLARSRTVSSESPLGPTFLLLALLGMALARLAGLAGGGGRP